MAYGLKWCEKGGTHIELLKAFAVFGSSSRLQPSGCGNRDKLSFRFIGTKTTIVFIEEGGITVSIDG
jgi:hypothetical protein